VTLPVLAELLLVNLLLIAGGLIVFLPDQVQPPGRKEIRRLLDKYGKFMLAGVAVLVVHLLLVQVDAGITSLLGWDFAPAIAGLEHGFVPSLAKLWNPPLNYFFSIMYIVVHPWMIYFPVLLFILSDEERPAKAMLLAYPLAYLMALPFYLFFPATNVYIYYGVRSPLFEIFPQLTDLYYNATTPNNTFPSLHVAFALLIANAARFSRNRRYRYFAYFYAVSVCIATLYLNIHWVVDVLGGAAIAGLLAVFISRFINTERLALQRVKPTPEEAQSVTVAAERLLSRVRGELDARGYARAKPMLVGSVAKDTYLRENPDMDVFVLFPVDTPRETLEKAGLEIGRAVLDEPTEKYAEHPYIHGTFEGHKADVVPAYEVADPSQKMTAVDRTPFHTRFVEERMQRDQRDQVRLLKAFMKGTGVYGAEAKTHGFSGYLCELLVLKFGAFRNVVRAGATWKPGTILVLDPIEGNPKFTDPLVFLDPIDVRRNVASAVSAETLAHFSEACRAYLRRESLSFFFPRQLVPLAPDELAVTLRRRKGDFVLLRTRAPPGVLEDHLYDQARKAAASIARLLERHGFEVRRATTEVNDEVRVLVELPRARISDTVTHVGPPVKSREHAERFRKTWSEHPDARSPVYEEEGRLKVERLREHRRAEQLLRDRLLEYDLGKHLNVSLKEGFEVLSGLDVVQDDTVRLLTKHLNRKKPWEV
jgi:tRNA nucleotidyltransferase (CCA-adding enzyme)